MALHQITLYRHCKEMNFHFVLAISCMNRTDSGSQCKQTCHMTCIFVYLASKLSKSISRQKQWNQLWRFLYLSYEVFQNCIFLWLFLMFLSNTCRFYYIWLHVVSLYNFSFQNRGLNKVGVCALSCMFHWYNGAYFCMKTVFFDV